MTRHFYSVPTTIAAFQVIDHGADGAQYFQGCGVSFTRFDHVVTGVGDTGADALDDALEQMASDGYGIPSGAQLEEMRAALSMPSKSAHDSLDPHDCEDTECSQWAHRVSVRYTAAKSDLRALEHCTPVIPQPDYQGHTWEEENGAQVDYGDWDNGTSGMWVLVDYAGGSDYSGSLVERANFNVLEKAAAAVSYPDDVPGFYVTLYGGHGTYGIAFHTERTPESIREMLVKLEDYPLVDEDEHSQLEMEAQDEAWENWARADYAGLLEAKFHGEADDVDAEAMFEHFRAAQDKANEYWINESGGSMWIDLKRVVEAADAPPDGFKVDSGLSGYTPCACRDCTGTAIATATEHPDFCNDCEEAGCERDSECSQEPDLEEES